MLLPTPMVGGDMYATATQVWYSGFSSQDCYMVWARSQLPAPSRQRHLCASSRLCHVYHEVPACIVQWDDVALAPGHLVLPLPLHAISCITHGIARTSRERTKQQQQQYCTFVGCPWRGGRTLRPSALAQRPWSEGRPLPPSLARGWHSLRRHKASDSQTVGYTVSLVRDF